MKYTISVRKESNESVISITDNKTNSIVYVNGILGNSKNKEDIIVSMRIKLVEYLNISTLKIRNDEKSLKFVQELLSSYSYTQILLHGKVEVTDTYLIINKGE